jgi:hypothetical protein
MQRRGKAKMAKADVDTASSEEQPEIGKQAADDAAELGRMFLDLMREQTGQNLEIWRDLTMAVDWEHVARPVDWGRVLELESQYLRQSLERAARLTQCCLEVGPAMIATTTSAAHQQAQKAA